MKFPADNAVNVPSAELPGLFPWLIDEYVGIVRELKPVDRDPGAPDFFHYRASACNTGAFTRQNNFSETGGAAPTRTAAACKAVGEAIERYCPAIYDVEALPLTSFEAAPFPCARPADFALYSAAQYAEPGFPWQPFEETTTVRWTPAVDPLSGETLYVPAARVYMPYSYYVGTCDTPIDQPISTGLACHLGYARAAISAICEVIERDAVLITWQAMLAPPQIRIETLDDQNYDLVQRFERAGFAVTMFDITLDHGVSSILSVLAGKTDTAPALVFAAATALNPIEAARKSLEELAHTARYCQYVKTHMPRLRVDPPFFSTVVDQMTHLNFYVDHAHKHYADFLFASRKRVDFSDLTNEASGDFDQDLRRLLERIRDVGEQSLLVDLTTPDLAPLGLRVVKCIIPGFHPLHMGFRLRSLGGKRLVQVPGKLGMKGITLESGDNPAPHPYP